MKTSNLKTNHSALSRNLLNILIATMLMLTLVPNIANAQTVSSTSTMVGETATFICTNPPIKMSVRWEVSTNKGATWSTVSGSNYTVQSTMLTILNTPDAFNGNQYRCVFISSGTIGENTIISTPGTLTVTSRPCDVKLNPDDQYTVAGLGVFFESEYSNGSSVTIQWQVSTNGGANWSNLSNTGIYSGVTTRILTLSNGITTAYNGYRYRCVFTNTQGLANPTPVYTRSATLFVTPNDPPVITTASLPNGSPGDYYNTILSATGSTPISWSINSGNLPNGLSLNSTTGVISGTLTSVGSFSFAVEARNKFGSDFATFTIVISAPVVPTITSHPANITVQEGVSASFSVAATGCTGTFLYQWEYRSNSNANWSNVTNGGIYSGATSSTLNLSTDVTLAQNGYQFRCYIVCSSSPNAPMTSNLATLTVTTAGIVGTPPVITTPSLPNGIKDTPYSETLRATGSTPITWSVLTGRLPNGLSLNTITGVIAGTPTTSDSFRFTVRASNDINPDDTKEFTLNVNNPPPAELIILTVPSETFCTVNEYLSVPFSQIDKQHPMKYRMRFSAEAIAAGFKDMTSFENLPSDLIFKIDVPKTAPTKSYSGTVQLSCEGVENYKEEYPFTVSVRNNNVVIVNQPPALQSLCSGASLVLMVDVSGTARSYQWYKNSQAITGARNKEYEVTTEGSYYVEIMGECGVIRSNVSVVAPSPASLSGISARVKWGNVLYVENATDKYVRYQWYHNGTAINNATFVYLSEKEGFLGEYYVRCFKTDGSYDETCPIVFDVRTKGVSANVYPTILKTNDLLHINLTDIDFSSEATVEIYSLLGTLTYSTKITPPNASIKPDFQQKGHYIIKINLPSGEILTEKIIVQ